MKHTRLRTSPFPVLMAMVLIGAIFLLDLSAPEGLATGVLYIAPVALVALWSPPTHYSLVVVFATACSILTIARFVYFSTEMLAWSSVSNHLLVVGALWILVLLSLLRKRMEQQSQWIDLMPRL